MNLLALPASSPDAFWRWCRSLLYLSFGLGLLLIGLFVWKAYDYLFVLPLAMLGALGLGTLVRFPDYLLYALLGGFVVMLGMESGFQAHEVLYGLAFFAYMGYWFVSRLFFYRTPLAQAAPDWALLLFLAFSLLSLGIAAFFDVDVVAMLGEWVALAMMALYFPVREVCRRNPQAPAVILLILGGLAVFIVFRNFYIYLTDLSLATYVWQIKQGRVTLNEHTLMMAGIGSLALFLYTRAWAARLVLLGLFGAFCMGIILGQSRALWVSMLLGLFVVFLFVDRSRRTRLILLGLGGFTLFLIAGFVFLEDFFLLVIQGLTERFSSLGSAATADLSLINRFVENGAAWAAIQQNPILGYGLGVPYEYYNLIYEHTHRVSFIHNAYLSLWYKHGLIGLGLVLTFYFGSVWRGLQLFRRPDAATLYRVIGLAVAAFLIAEALVANTQNPFGNLDKTYMFGVLAGLVSGLSERADRLAGR